MEKKALQLASVASMIDQFNMSNIAILQSLGYRVDVAADFTNPGTITKVRAEELKKILDSMDVRVFDIPIPRSLNPKEIITAYKQVKSLLDKEGYTLLHCHSPIGGVIAREAAKRKRKTGMRVIYTAHGFHFYDGAPIKNWMLFYPIEKHYARYTDVLITINREDYKRASTHFRAKKTVYIPGVGIDMKKFKPNVESGEKKRAELGVKESDIMLLSVGELSIRKNHEVVIRALHELYNPNVKYFICGMGELEGYLKKIIQELDMEKQVVLTGYCTDILELLQAADVFVFPSMQEGLPVALMEAIACKTPIICSRIRGNKDLIMDNGLMFDGENAQELVSIFKKNVSVRIELQKKMEKSVKRNYVHLKSYSLSKISEKMRSLYNNLGNVSEDSEC